jgi:hypothetical protein
MYNASRSEIHINNIRIGFISVSITGAIQLMLSGYDNHCLLRESYGTHRGQNAGFFSVKSGGTYNYHCALTGQEMQQYSRAPLMYCIGNSGLSAGSVTLRSTGNHRNWMSSGGKPQIVTVWTVLPSCILSVVMVPDLERYWCVIADVQTAIAASVWFRPAST